MTVHLDVWLRGEHVATTRTVDGPGREPRDWTLDDVRAVLEQMLLAMHRLKHPDETEQGVALRGLSWIVSPYEEGGVLIAIEISMGAVVAGPFDIDGVRLETMIANVLAGQQPSGRVH